METLWQDLKYGVRTLLRNKGFTIIAVLALALGIGANTAIFSVVNAVLLRPLPYPHPDRLVEVFESNKQSGEESGTISFPNLKDWKEQSQSFSQIAAYEYDRFILTGRDAPERFVGLNVAANFFQALDVSPASGRAFQAQEDQPGAPRVVILSHNLWQRRFAGDAKLIGQTLTLNNESYTVIGIMPQGFESPETGIELWSPLIVDPERGRGGHFLSAIARLKPDVTIEQAQTEMDTIARRLAQAYPDTNKNAGVKLIPLRDYLVGNIRSMLLVLLGAVGFVLLIACANVAALLLAQATARQKEMAIRTALGAGRGRLVRQFLTESVLLSLLGGGLGLLLTLWGIDLLAAAIPGNIYNAKAIGVDTQVLGFTLLVSLLTGLLFGLAPALQSSQTDLNESLKEGGRGASGGRRRQRLFSALIVSEFALALVLLIGGGLLIKSFWRLQQIDPGFNPEHLLTMQLSLPKTRYAESQQQINFFNRVLEHVATLPGIEAVGLTSELPFNGSRTGSSFAIEGQTEDSLHADNRTISSDYFRAMGIPLVRGRAFTPRDAANATRVAIINETSARRFWPAENPIGKRLILKEVKYEIIGIVKDVKHIQLTEETAPEIYVHYPQVPSRTWMDLAARTTNNPENSIASIRRAIREVDPNQPVYGVRTMEQKLSRSISAQRFSALLLGIFAAVALILAAVGIYGVIAYSVTQRTHEIGVRLALGAQAGDVFKLIVGQGLRLALIGVAAGLLGAFAVTRVMASLLYGVSATDPLIFFGVSLLLAAVAFLACYIPARRATKVDPMIALRYE